MDRWPTGAHGSTFGGNPVACAAALATLDVLDEEGCYERARRARRAGPWTRLGAAAGHRPSSTCAASAS